MTSLPALDVLIPTCCRPAALAVTLAGLCAQTLRGFRVVISDQTEKGEQGPGGEVEAAIRLLRLHGSDVETNSHLPRRGMAEQRAFLLSRARAPYVLFLDDDLMLEPDVVERILRALRAEGCGFAGCGLIGLSYINDVRLDEQQVEFWNGPVVPETVQLESVEWQRHRLHNAANLLHLQQRLGVSPENERRYRVAWIGGCVMYDTAKLRSVGGFEFWRDLPPEHAGEDVLAQLRVMERYGGFGLLPSGVYHQELPTTVVDRRVGAERAFLARCAPLRPVAQRGN